MNSRCRNTCITSSISDGVIIRVSPSPDLHDFGSSAIPNLLLAHPDGRERPELVGGESFVDTGAFKLTVLQTARDRARLRFRWTDATAPRAPRFDAAFVGGRVQVTLDSAHELGSGVARYDWQGREGLLPPSGSTLLVDHFHVERLTLCVNIECWHQSLLMFDYERWLTPEPNHRRLTNLVEQLGR